MINRSDILRLAAESQLDPRTVQRALEKGIGSIRAEVDRARLIAAAEKLKIAIGHRMTSRGTRTG